MQKFLFVDPEKCTGCRICEINCVFNHEKECNPARARIHVLKWEEEGVDIPITCLHCQEPPCEAVCPVGAIYKDEKTGAWLINDEKCIKCRLCTFACPVGAVSYDVKSKKMAKCDLCGGDPICAKLCTEKAIEYTSPTKAMLLKKRSATKKFQELTARLVPQGT
jgi:Fe-S-cluster-containing hydrogenase component 2